MKRYFAVTLCCFVGAAGCTAEVIDDEAAAGEETTVENDLLPEVAVTQQALSGFDQFAIGVIPTDFVEDDWGSNCGGFGRARMYMDDEDDSSNTRFTPWLQPFDDGQSDDRQWFGNTTIEACRVDGRNFKAMTTSSASTSKFYAVLKLGQDCPNGSQEFSRYIDNEDDNNNNDHSGPIAPNVSNDNTTLKFCLFRYSASNTMSSFPDLGMPYGVFHDFDGSQPSWVIQKRWVRSDDEDDNNHNSVTPASSDFQNIIEAWANTRFDMARVR
jgi:hypothetical protein